MFLYSADYCSYTPYPERTGLTTPTQSPQLPGMRRKAVWKLKIPARVMMYFAWRIRFLSVGRFESRFSRFTRTTQVKTPTAFFVPPFYDSHTRKLL